MPTLDDYATWIIENKDKKGTPEFDTVAAAWQELRDATPTSTLPPPATRELGLLDTLGGGVSRGMSRLGSTFTDVIPAMVGSAIGEEEYAEEQLAEAAEKQRVSELLNPTQFASYKDVEGIGDFTRFAAETIGEQFGNLGLTLGAALTGGALAAPAIGARVGQLAGAAFGSYALNAPEVFENIHSETGETAPGTALLFGAGAAALDSVLPAALARNISGPMKAGIVTSLLARSGMQPGVLRSGTAGLFSGLGVEGITEGAQEGISIAAERFIDDNPDVFGSREWDRIMEASVRGAVAGGGFGTVGGGIQGARESAEASSQLRDMEEAAELRQKTEGKYQGQQELPFASPVTPEQSREERQESLEAMRQQTLAQEAREADLGVQEAEQIAPIVSMPYALETARRQNLNVPKAGSLKTLNQEQKEIVEQVQREESERILYEDAVIEAERTGVEFDATKPFTQLNPQERELLDTLAQRRRGRFDREKQGVLFTPKGKVEPKIEKKAKAFDRAEAKRAKDAEKRRTQSEEVTTEEQADMFEDVSETEVTTTVIPTDKQGLRAWGKDNFGLGHSAAVLREDGPLAGKDLSDPTQAAEVQDILIQVQQKSKSATIPGRIAEYLAAPEFEAVPPVQEEVTETWEEDIDERNQAAAAERQKDFENLQKASTLENTDLGKPVESYRTKMRGQEETRFNVYKTPEGYVTEITRPSAIEGQPPAVSRTQHKNKKQVEDTKKKLTDSIGVLTRVRRKEFNKPTYQGKTFNREQRRIAERGNFKQLLSSLINTQPKEIQRILRKIRSQNLKTKLIVGATPEGTSGYYDPPTDTIVLNPQDGLFAGLTEETFLHETIHAALAQAINNPDLQITKDFDAFFTEIKDQMGGLYGGNNLQEFAAELVSNPEFQALLKDTRAPKAPAGRNLWTNIMEAIARFFGFRSAYDTGLDFIDKILDVSQGVEPTLTDRMFLGTPNVAAKAFVQTMNSGEPLTGKKKEQVLNGLSKLKSGRTRDMALSAFRLQDFIRLLGDKIPALRSLQRALLNRQGAIEKDIARVQDNYRDFRNLVQDEKLKKQAQELNDIAQVATLDGFDLVGVDGTRFDPAALTPDQRADYKVLQARFNRLDPRLKDMYKKIRQEYLDSFNAYRDNVLSQVADGNKRAELRKDFEAQHPLVGYVPQIRFGEYMVEYTDANGRTGLSGFESPRERAQFIENNNVQVKNTFDKLEDVSTSNNLPPNNFLAKLLQELPPQLHEQVYQTHFSFFPDSSFVQRFRRRHKDAQGRGVLGASKDLTKVYGDTMVKWARKKNNLKYLPTIEQALTDIAQTRGVRTGDTYAGGTTGLEAAVRQEIINRGDFMRSPHYGAKTSFFATSAYNLYLTGNASAAIVNLSAVPLLSLPLLGGPFGFGKANAALLRAMKVAHPFGREKMGWDTGTVRNPHWVDMPQYKKLAEALDAVGQRQHTLQREITEGARQSTEEYTGLGAKVMSYLSIPFTEAEKYSRSVTGIAAYELAKQKRPTGKKYQRMTNEEAAIEYAIEVVTDVHTSGMAAEGPRAMQHPIGRVMFTFKTFIWNSAVVTAWAMKQAGMFRPLGIQGAMTEQGTVDAEARRIARRQVLGIYGMSAAIAGINGLPFFGATATLVNIINAIIGDEDEPFNFRNETSLFVDELAFKGPLNYLTNFEISNRVGLANGLLFREDPYSIEESGYVMTALAQAMGPVGSYFLGVEQALLEGGRKEMLFPSGFRNILKAWRFHTEGATTKNGDPIISNISGYNLMFQAFGFGPADLSNIYEMRSAALNFENKVDDRLSEIKRKYVVAKDTGNIMLELEAVNEMDAMRMRHPDKINPDTLERSYNATKSYRERVINGVSIDPAINNPYLEQLLLLD